MAKAPRQVADGPKRSIVQESDKPVQAEEAPPAEVVESPSPPLAEVANLEDFTPVSAVPRRETKPKPPLKSFAVRALGSKRQNLPSPGVIVDVVDESEAIRKYALAHNLATHHFNFRVTEVKKK